MALQVVSMEELRLQVLLEPRADGRLGSPRSAADGGSRARRSTSTGAATWPRLDGLVPRSRRPRFSPARIEPQLEARIVALRREHPRWGARRIRAELRRAGIDPPAKSTIHQVLTRNHLVAPRRPRRPTAGKRFERELPNDLWQIDGTQVALAAGERVWVVDVLDDHARYLLAALAATSLSREPAWACFVVAAAQHGLPRQLLSDNGSYFTGRLLGFEADFRAQARRRRPWANGQSQAVGDRRAAPQASSSPRGSRSRHRQQP